MSDLYVWFLQKTAPKGKGQPLPYPLPNAIAILLAETEFNNSLIVSPGFLSTRINTTQDFYDKFSNLLCAACRKAHSKNCPNDCSCQQIDFGFLRGMPKDLSSFNKHLDLQKKDLSTRKRTPPMGCSPVFNLQNTKSDHRKMVFLYSIKPGKDEDVKNLKQSSKQQPLDQMNALRFASYIQVNAVAIGSSNFSKSTYFGYPFTQGEADVILLAHDDAGSPASNFTSVIEGFSNTVAQRSGQTEIVEDFPNSAFAKSMYSGGINPHTYLSNILKETIKQTLK